MILDINEHSCQVSSILVVSQLAVVQHIHTSHPPARCEWSKRRRRPDCLPMAPSATLLYPFTPFLYQLPSTSGISIIFFFQHLFLIFSLYLLSLSLLHMQIILAKSKAFAKLFCQFKKVQIKKRSSISLHYPFKVSFSL